MNEYKIQVKLKDGTVTDFEKFVVSHPTNSSSKEFDNLNSAERYIQQMNQNLLKDFMVEHFYGGNIYKIKDELPLEFISWYINLDVFDKMNFIKLLQKIYKIDG